MTLNEYIAVLVAFAAEHDCGDTTVTDSYDHEPSSPELQEDPMNPRNSAVVLADRF